MDHRAHLALAWTCLVEAASIDAATTRISAELRELAVAAGRPDKYHETQTVFWMRLVASARTAQPFAASVDDLLLARPDLLDQDVVFSYYSRDRFHSDEARRGWVAPDLRDV